MFGYLLVFTGNCNDPDTQKRFIWTAFMSDQLQKDYWVIYRNYMLLQ